MTDMLSDPLSFLKNPQSWNPFTYLNIIPQSIQASQGNPVAGLSLFNNPIFGGSGDITNMTTDQMMNNPFFLMLLMKGGKNNALMMILLMSMMKGNNPIGGSLFTGGSLLGNGTSPQLTSVPSLFSIPAPVNLANMNPTGSSTWTPIPASSPAYSKPVTTGQVYSNGGIVGITNLDPRR